MRAGKPGTGVGPLTIEEFEKLPEEDLYRLELVRGWKRLVAASRSQTWYGGRSRKSWAATVARPHGCAWRAPSRSLGPTRV